jgi:pimeloyl-ACP methyl ester carboxylesterase
MSSMYEDVEGAVALRHFPAPADAYERGLTSIRRVIVLGTASRYLFPIPDTGIADRLYRLSPVPTVALFGASDRLVPRSLADDWRTLAPRADVRVIDEALHMHPYERSDFSEAVSALVSEAAGAG